MERLGNYKDVITREIYPDTNINDVYVLINDIYNLLIICPHNCFNLMLLKFYIDKYYTKNKYNNYINFEKWLLYYLKEYNMNLSTLQLDKVNLVDTSDEGIKFLNNFADLFFKELSRISQADHYIICKDRNYIELYKFLDMFYISDKDYLNYVSKLVSISEEPKVLNIALSKYPQD